MTQCNKSQSNQNLYFHIIVFITSNPSAIAMTSQLHRGNCCVKSVPVTSAWPCSGCEWRKRLSDMEVSCGYIQ